jgi:Xaa-Pro aminopeptidase
VATASLRSDAPSDADVARRRAQVQAVLADNGWDAAVVVGQENGQHLTGWDIEITRYWPDRPLVVVATPDETVLVVWAEMIKMGKKPGPYVDRLVGYSRGGDGHRTAAEAVVHLLREAGLERALVGLEKSRAHVNFLERIVDELPGLQFEAADDALARLRMVKTERELDALTAAAQRADTAFWSAIADAQPGITELELAGRIRAAAAEAGCLVTMLTVAAGERACAVNEPTHRPIENGDIIRFDFNMRHGAFHLDDVYYGGYFADLGRMAVMGEASREQVQAYREQVELKRRIIEFVRPGVSASEIYRRYRTVAAELGVELFLLPSIGVGHGIGIVNDEAPRLTEIDETVIEAGMALALEPDTIGPGNALMHVEDVVAVRDDGAELISWSRDWSELAELGRS